MAGSESVIDHILTNVKGKIRASGVLNIGFSDHLITYVTRGTPKSSPCGPVTFARASFTPIIKRIRSLKNYSKEFLCAELKKIDWSRVLFSGDVDSALNEFVLIFRAVLDRVAPYRDIRIKQKTEPWMNREILCQIRKRDALLTKFKKDKSQTEVYSEYCRIRNKIQREIKAAKASFFERKLEQNKNDTRRLWSQLSSLGYGDAKSGHDIVIEVDGEKCFDPRSVSGSFNTFFTRIASDLVGKLPNPYDLFRL